MFKAFGSPQYPDWLRTGTNRPREGKDLDTCSCNITDKGQSDSTSAGMASPRALGLEASRWKAKQASLRGSDRGDGGV